MTSRILVFVVLSLLPTETQALASSQSGALLIFGQQSAKYKLTPVNPSFRLPDYQNDGYSQVSSAKQEGWEIQVVIHSDAIQSQAAARVVGPLGPELEALRETLNREKKSLANQIHQLFSWLRASIHQETIYQADQSLSKVLASKSANCVGLTALALYVMRKMGLEARFVTGIAYRAKDQAEMLLEGTVLHRWLEIRYPDSGWVFADPAGLVNFVEATYLVLGIEGLDPIETRVEQALGSRIELMSLKNGLRPIARLPGLDARLRVRAHQPLK